MKKLLQFLFNEYLKYPWLATSILGLMAITLAYQIFFSMAFKYIIDDILVPGKYEMLTVFLLFIIGGAII